MRFEYGFAIYLSSKELESVLKAGSIQALTGKIFNWSSKKIIPH